MSYGRTKKQIKLDTEKEFDEMIKQGPSERAKWHMQRKPCQVHNPQKEREWQRDNTGAAFQYDVQQMYGVRQCLTKWGIDLNAVIGGGDKKQNHY